VSVRASPDLAMLFQSELGSVGVRQGGRAWRRDRVGDELWVPLRVLLPASCLRITIHFTFQAQADKFDRAT
jgi:hypothetical protein